MGPYQFLPRTPEYEAIRRAGLDWHANAAQLSQLLCILALPLGRYALTTLVTSFRTSSSSVYNAGAKPGSGKRSGQHPKATSIDGATKDVDSFFSTEIAKGWGTYGQWIFGLVWASWLGFLIVHDTVPGLVKRFGVVAASQLPGHYLLSMKHSYAPLRLLNPDSSRQQLLSLHFVTGRLVILFVAIHATLYSGIFLSLNLFWASVKQRKIIVALISLSIFATIAITSRRNFRRQARSTFYAIHLVGSTLMLPLMYFHVVHIRLYLYECAAVVGLNAVLRLVS